MTDIVERSQSRWLSLWPVAVLAFLSLAMFGDLLVNPSKVLGQKETDVALQFLPWRKFGFDQLRRGNLALWNPHIFGGAPFFAGFQSALLYPPNWLHLIVPVGLAIDWIIAIHVFLAGLFMYLWCRHRGLAKAACLLAGAMYMFSGPYFLHVFAGHLPHIAIMVWTPLLLLAIDLASEGEFIPAILLGIFSMSMLLLAGHPQYVYYTGMACVVYVLVNLIFLPKASSAACTLQRAGSSAPGTPLPDPEGSPVGRPLGDDSARAENRGAKFRACALVACLMIVFGGAGITAIQLLSGMDAASESVRSGGIKYEFSATFSFPPENLLTLIAPNVLGDLNPAGESNYFGRNYLWECSLFLSVTGVILAGYGAIASTRHQRRGAIVMVVICFILALGAHTPVHRFLYDHLHGFGDFRGSTKFIYLVAIFLCLLAACGMDALLRAGRASIGLLLGVAAALIGLLIFASLVRISAHHGVSGAWAHLLRSTMENAFDAKEMYWNPIKLGDVKFLADCGDTVSRCLFIACGIMALVLAILAATRRNTRFAYLLVALATIELFIYGRSTRATTPVDLKLPLEQWTSAIKSAPPESRFLDVTTQDSNMGMWFGYDEIWGYDPGVLKRYAELVTTSQQYPADDATQYVAFRKLDLHVFPLLRCAAVLLNDPNHPVVWVPHPMSEVQLISRAYMAPTRDAILGAIQSDDFDPHREVMLESPPNIRPAGSADPGSVEILSQSTDQIELEANVKSPAILLITNAYSHGWRVESIGASPPGQNAYQLMPADWALQAIPLAAGTHHLKLEYLPEAFVIGKWISIAALVGYITFLAWWIRSGKSMKHAFNS